MKLGIRASLLLAFLVVSAFVILASGAALQAILRVSAVLDDVTLRQAPATLASLDLSRRVERFVAAAQQVSVAENRDEYRASAAELDIKPLLAALAKIPPEKSEPLRASVDELAADLARLDRAVANRLTLAEGEARALHELLDADLSFQYAVRPVQRAWSSDALGIEAFAGRSDRATSPAALKGLLALNRLRRLEIAFARTHDLLLIGATATSEVDLQLTMTAVGRALGELDQAIAEAPPDLEAAITEGAKLRPQFEAESGLLPLHRRELEERVAAGGLVAETRAVSQRLRMAVDALVEADGEIMRQGVEEVGAVRRASMARLLAVIAASLVCSALIVGLYVNRHIVARLAEVRDSMLALAQGRLSGELPPPGEDEIGRMASALAIFRSTAIERDEREAARALAETRLKRTLADVANLLDSSGEGFLSFGPDLIVDPQCSRACDSLLGAAPAGRDAGELLFGKDRVRRELLADIVDSLVKTEDPRRREVVLSLLPEQISCEGRLLEARYRILDNGHLMVVLSDVTERVRLAESLRREHLQVSMVVAVVTEGGEFFAAAEAFRRFLHKEIQLLAETAPQDLYREIHTYKGVLAQFSFVQVPELLHQAEERLADALRQSSPPGPDILLRAVDIPALLAAFELDWGGLEAILGKDFLSGAGRVFVGAELADRIEWLAQKLLRGETIDPTDPVSGAVLRDILLMRRQSMRDGLLGYGRMMEELAARQNKRVAPISVQGDGDVSLDPARHGAFLRSLVHLFRNAVVHGIETPDERLASGKAEEGRIVCTIGHDAGRVTLAIADDGQGLDIGKLRRRAVEYGIRSSEAAADMPEAEIAALIFEDEISTRDVADLDSGRGVGLSAVRKEVRRLGGEITVQSASGEGTRFFVTFPETNLSS